MAVAPYIVLGAAGLARELLAGQGGGKYAAKPSSPEHLAAVSVATSGPMPCGVEQVTDHGVITVNFGGHWNIQRESLRAKFGDAFPGLVGNITRVPAIGRECALSWCQQWDQIFLDALKGPQGDKLEPTANGFDLADRLIALRIEIEKLESPFASNKAIWPDLGSVMRTTASLANAMDSAIHTDFSVDAGLPSNGELIAGEARNVAGGIATSVGFAIENLLGPIAGAGIAASLGVLGSTLAPYLLLGGATYYAVKKGA